MNVNVNLHKGYAEDQTVTESSMRDSMLAEIRKLCIADINERGEFVKLENLCCEFELDELIQLINRRKDTIAQCKAFFEKCMKDISLMTLKPLKVMISIAMIYGNPFFNKIPDIIEKSNEEVDEDELIGHL